MANESGLELVTRRGWRRGLENLLDKEFGQWWHTRRWWTQALIWTAVIGFLLGGVVLKGTPNDKVSAVLVYGIFASLFPTVAVVIQMQSALVGEKSSGTAAWVLSKPVSRSAFILAKLVANSLAVLAVNVAIPGLVAYPFLCIAQGGLLNPLLFVAGLGVVWLFLLYFLALTLMLGAFFNRRGAVIGISLGLLLLQQYVVGLTPVFRTILPWTLTIPVNNASEALLPTLLLGQNVRAFLPQVLVILAEIGLFVWLAIRRFNKEEF